LPEPNQNAITKNIPCSSKPLQKYYTARPRVDERAKSWFE
jgi:hypothetical protein